MMTTLHHPVARRGPAILAIVLIVSALVACSDTPMYVPDIRIRELDPEPVLGQPRIAFASTRDRESYIYVADLDGSNVTRLVRGKDPTWSPDGRYLAYTRGEWIYRATFDGSGARQLVRGWEPAWSADGRIAYRSEDGIAVVGAAGSSQQVVVHRGEVDLENCGDVGLSGPAWSPDGRALAFIAPLYGSEDCEIAPSSLLTIVILATKEVRMLSGDLPLGAGAWDWGGGPYPPAWSADGTRIAVSGTDPSTSEQVMVVFDVASGEQSIVLRRSWFGSPEWSPDGRRLVFTANFDGSSGRIYSLSLETGAIQQLIPDAFSPFEPEYNDSDPSWVRLLP